MTTKNDMVVKAISETLVKIKNFAQPNNKRYQQLVKDLIVEGMVKLLEPVCLVRVRTNDVDFVKGILKDCESEFGKLMKKETGNEFKCVLLMDETEHLNHEGGGVNLLSKDKKLMVINDLESRLNLAKEQYLPVVKTLLYPAKGDK